jgi:hypothetical protein
LGPSNENRRDLWITPACLWSCFQAYFFCLAFAFFLAGAFALAAARFIGFFAAFFAGFFFATGRLAAFVAGFFFLAGFFLTGIGTTPAGGAASTTMGAGDIEGIAAVGIGIFAVDILGS